MIRNALLAAGLIAGLLAGGGELRAEQEYDYDDAGTGALKCADGRSAECLRATTEKCIEYEVVEVQVGSKVEVVRVCSRKVTSTTYYYWT